MTNSLSARLLAGVSVIAIPFFTALSANAQAVDTPQTLQSAQAVERTSGPGPAEEVVPDRVVVTGSRLADTGFTTPTPVTQLDREVLDKQPAVDIGDVLAQVPTFRVTTGPSQNQRNIGAGQNTLDLRGLGAGRTLVLVDGLRFTPTNTSGSFDTNQIPSGLVDRIDVVTGGASAAYGSDAVSGVVNIILKNHLDGIQGTVQYGISEQGDQQQPLLSLAAGTSFADGRGHILIGGDVATSTGVGTIYTRDWGQQNPGLIAFPATRGAGVPSRAFETNVTYAAQAPGGLVTSGPLKGLAFGDNAVPFNFQPGAVYSNLMIGGSNPGMNPFGHWPLDTPIKREAVLGRVSYDINDSITAYADLNYGFSEGDGYTSWYQGAFVIGNDNPFLPASVKASMATAGVTTLNIGKVLTADSGGGYPQKYTHETVRGVAGLKGTFGDTWSWDISYQDGRSNTKAFIYNDLKPANLLAAVSVVTGANGAPVCAPIATNPNLTAASRLNVQPGCVAYNVFGNNSPSQAAVDYVTGTNFQGTTLNREAESAELRGSPFKTWAGPVQIAVGAEHRDDSLSNNADADARNLLYALQNSQIYSGRETVTEEFGEIGVPLATDQFLAHSLGFNGAFRHTDYSLSGAVDTWKAGLTYEPIQDLRFRLTQSRDIRAPDLGQLFATTGRGVNTASFLNPINHQTGVLYVSTSGNLGLEPEIAKTLTGGVVYQPSAGWLEGLSASLDFYSIKIEKAIGGVGASQILTNCAAGQTAYCNFVTFDNTTFGIFNVATTSFNLNRLETEGVDYEIAYKVPMDQLKLPGSLDFRLLGGHVTKLRSTAPGSTPVELSGSLQNSGVPEWSANLMATYSIDRLNVNLSARYFSESLYDATLVGPDSSAYNPAASNSIGDNVFPAEVYFNLGASYDLIKSAGKQLQIFGQVNNLLNTQPPVFAAIAISSGGDPYDLIGRRFLLGFRFKN